MGDDDHDDDDDDADVTLLIDQFPEIQPVVTKPAVTIMPLDGRKQKSARQYHTSP